MTAIRFAIAVSVTWFVVAGSGFGQPPEEAAPDSPTPEATASEPTSPDTPDATSTDLSADAVRDRIVAAESHPTLPEAQRQRLAGLYKNLLSEMETRETLQRDIQKWASLTDQIESQLTAAEAATARTPESEPQVDQLTIKQIKQQEQDTASQLDEARTSLSEKTLARSNRAIRREEIVERFTGLQSLQTDLAQPAGDEGTDPLPLELRSVAERLRQYRLANTNLESRVLHDELSYYDASEALLDLQIQVAQSEVERLTEALGRWRQYSTEREQAEALEGDAEMERSARQAPDELLPLVEKNQYYRDRLTELYGDKERKIEGKIAAANDQLTETQQLNTAWKERVRKIDELVTNHSYVTESVGQSLRDQRSQLPDARQRRRAVQRRHQTIYEIRSIEFNLEQEESRLAEPKRAAAQELANLRLTKRENAQLSEPAQRILRERAKTIGRLRQAYRTYRSNLTTLNIEDELLIQLVERHIEFIDEKVLWARSTSRLRWQDVPAIAAATAWLCDVSSWSDLGRQTTKLDGPSLAIHITFGIATLVLGFLRRQLVPRIRTYGSEASQGSCREFGITIMTTCLIAVVTMVGPAILLWLSFVLDDLDRSASLARPLAFAFRRSAWVAWPLLFWRRVVEEQSLGPAHFDWSEQATRKTRRHLTWLIPVLVVSVWLFDVITASGIGGWATPASRWCLIVATSGTAMFLVYFFSPRRGVLQAFLGRYRGGWIDKTRWVWFPAIVAIPLVIAALALGGYLYTAQRLSECLYQSAVFLSMLVLFESLTLRWALTNRRKLAIEQARDRLAAIQTTEADAHADTSSLDAAERKTGPAPLNAVTESDQVDLSEVDAQTRRILKSFGTVIALLGLYLIWIDVLPALRVLSQYPLLKTSHVVGTAEGASEEAIYDWITLGELTATMLVLLFSWVAIRNIPGLLEIAVLQHLPLDATTRYAITTVVRYWLTVVGVGYGLSTVGIGWAQVQWLAAGVSVGLGFGLQEVFANFVSGVILLFERPLRAGDVITIGDTTGTVVRINTRATTVRDWDHRELVVPNKEFITGRLLNWTLTDQVNRIVLTVGVAYGSDVEKVRRIIHEVLKGCDALLSDPAPSVIFDELGDSALCFTVRAYLPDMSNRLSTTDSLYESLYNRLNSEGIEIPFPQRDVHLYREK